VKPPLFFDFAYVCEICETPLQELMKTNNEMDFSDLSPDDPCWSDEFTVLGDSSGPRPATQEGGYP
jgi:hypothetical protein